MARYDQLDAIRQFGARAAQDAGMDDSDIYAVELSMDEACTNIIEHAYEDIEGGEIEVSCNSDDKKLTIILHDHGKPFDPASVEMPNVEADLDTRPIGGLGVFLIKKLMDEVHFESLGENGNVLTMVKYIRYKRDKEKVPPPPSTWKQIVILGDKLIHSPLIDAQNDLIIDATARLMKGKADLWLDEKLFRMPGIRQEAIYPSEPPSEEMKKALSTGQPRSSSDSTTIMAVPLMSGGIVVGALQVKRNDLPFSKKDIDLLDGLSGHVALALVASHRFAIEQWRIEQLTLVRRVSVQIANVLNINKLTRRVTKLIQQTFHYYYVAIFTRETETEELNFRSSAADEGGRIKRVKAKLGEGLIGTVAQSGEETISYDVHTDNRYRCIDYLPDTESEAVLPLKIEDRILGVLDVQSNQTDSFHPNDLLVLRALANSIAIAINSARLYNELERRVDQLAMVAEVSKNITSTLNLEELLNKVAVLIQERLGFPYVHLYSVHPNRRKVIFEAGSGKHNLAQKEYALDLDQDKGIICWVAREGRTLLVNDISQEPLYQPSPFPPDDTRSEMTIPLLFDEKVIGVLDLQSNRVNAFNDESRFLCEALADNVAVAVRNAGLYQSERSRRQVADGLREVAGLISADVGLEDVLDSVLHELERNLPCDVVAIWLLEGEHLYLAQAHGGNMVEIENAADRWPEAYQFLAAALTSERPIIRKLDDPIGPTGTALGYAADYSSVAAALRAGDRPLGVITLTHHLPGRYGHEAQDITATFANSAAVAIENARLYDSAQEQAYASAALLQVAQAVANSNDLNETIGSVVRITPILVGVNACAIFLLQAELFHLTQLYGFNETAQVIFLNHDFKPGDFALLDAIRETSRMVIGLFPAENPNDWLNLEIAHTEEEKYFALEAGGHLLIGFPLMVKNELFGVMLVEEGADARRFRQKRIEIVTSIAHQVALSIQNEHLQQEMVIQERLEHEVQLARQIQKTFLPEHLPVVKGWDLAATWITARQVGGDFYDVIKLPGGRLGLFIADVSDKGIPAALFMALTRTMVRAVIFDTGSPAEVMQRVNALIIPDNHEGMFVTAVYGVLVLESGLFTYANAGHNPPILSSGIERKLISLQRTGAAIGIIEDLQLEDRTVSLKVNDFLLLYTDGLTEAFSPDEESYGEERLQHMLEVTEAVTAQGLLDTLEASVKDFMGPLPPTDDLTMLGIKRTRQINGHIIAKKTANFNEKVQKLVV